MDVANITKHDDLGLRLGAWNDWSVPALGPQKVLVYPSVTSLNGPSGIWLCGVVMVDDTNGGCVAGTWSPVFAREDKTNPSGFVLMATHATVAEAKEDALRLLRNAEASLEQGRQKTRMTRWRYNIDGTIRPREPTMWLMIILSGYIGISMSMSIFDPQQPLTVTGVALVGGTIGTLLVMLAALITSSVFAFITLGLSGFVIEMLFGARVNAAILAHVGCNWGAIAILAVAALWLAAEGSNADGDEGTQTVNLTVGKDNGEGNGTGQRVSREDLRHAATAAFEAAGMTKDEIAWAGRELIGLGLIPLSNARAEQGAYALGACLMGARSSGPHALKMEACSVARLWVCDLLEAEFREHTAYPEYQPLDFFGEPIPWDYERCKRNATDLDELERVVEQGARTAKGSPLPGPLANTP